MLPKYLLPLSDERWKRKNGCVVVLPSLLFTHPLGIPIRSSSFSCRTRTNPSLPSAMRILAYLRPYTPQKHSYMNFMLNRLGWMRSYPPVSRLRKSLERRFASSKRRSVMCTGDITNRSVHIPDLTRKSELTVPFKDRQFRGRASSVL